MCSRPTRPSTSPGTASAATSCCTTRAFARRAFARSFRSTASAFRSSARTKRRRRSRDGSTRCSIRKEFATYASFDAVADRLQKNNARLPRDKAEFLARHWAEPTPDGRVRLASDPRHRLPFPTVYRIEETYAVWRNIAAPALWVVGTESNIPKWLAEHPEGEGGTDSLAGVRRRLAHIRDGRLVTIADAGHMLHHDQPAAVAAAIEDFVAEIRSR